MAEGSEFELSVPVSKLPDDSTMLEIATARRLALRAQTTSCRRYSAFDENISPMRDIRIPPGEPWQRAPVISTGRGDCIDI
jgi:hypothetical protein